MSTYESTVLCIGMGNIGSAVISELNERKGVQVITASRKSGDLNVDLSDVASIKALDDQLAENSIDAVVVTCGASTFGPLAAFDDLDKWDQGLQGKLLSVTKLVLMLIHQHVKFLKDGGSITITTGMAATTLNKMWPGIAVNNAGLNAFVRNGGIDLPRSLRLNGVAPALVRETAAKAGLPLEGTVPAETVGKAYIPLIFGKQSGEITCVGEQVAFKSTHDKNHDATMEK